jgi:hypothetical protein
VFSAADAACDMLIEINRARVGRLESHVRPVSISIEFEEVERTPEVSELLDGAARLGVSRVHAFQSPEQVYAFFAAENIAHRDGAPCGLGQDVLDRMADAVMLTRTNCEF